MSDDHRGDATDMIGLLRREGLHSGVWFKDHLLKAALQIEALQAENAKMREALDPFAELGAVWSKADETDNSCWATMDPATRLVVGGGDIGWNAVTVGQLRAAHDALTPTKDHPHAAS